MSQDPEETQSAGPVIRDKRRIDPQTGEVRTGEVRERTEDAAPASPTDADADAAEERPDVTSDTASSGMVTPEAQLAERTADLQRLQAEYRNYKRRVDRDRENASKNAVASTLTSLLPVLDDIDRAREHGELTGGFKAVAESFQRVVEKMGLAPFGEAGDPFDPRIHDALTHTYSADVTGPTCLAIVQVGYRLDDRVLRPAMVAVAEPTVAVDAPVSEQTEVEPSDDSYGGPQ